MTIFHGLAGMCLVAIDLWLMFFFPYRFNEYFKEAYGHKAWSTGAIAAGFVIAVKNVMGFFEKDAD